MATFLGYSGALMRWGILYVKTMWAAYWQYILGYVFVFGVIGYFATFYALRSGFVERCAQTRPPKGHPTPHAALLGRAKPWSHNRLDCIVQPQGLLPPELVLN
eukprot:scaffold67058_cov35-Tisochrysis_lutea.AAC.2